MALPKVTEPIAGQWPVSVAWRGWLESLDRRISLLANTEAPTQTTPDPPQLVQGEGINVYGGIGWGQVATLSLRPLPDSGVGASLAKITRDEYGRVEGTEAATTDDLTEGAANLYHTPERVRDVMGTALVAGSNVTITVNDPGDTITIAAAGGGGGSGSLIKLGEVVVTSATTDIDFTGLDLDAHGEYEIRLYDIPNAAGGRSIFLYYNTDYTSSNYSNRYIGNDGAAPFGNGGNSAEIAAHGNASVIVGGRLSIQLSKSAGHRAYAYSHLARHSGSAFGNITYAHQWYASTANVTAIKLRCSVANGFGVGTRARLYRLA